MALNPTAHTEKVVRSSLKYQPAAHPFAAPRLHAQMRMLPDHGLGHDDCANQGNRAKKPLEKRLRPA